MSVLLFLKSQNSVLSLVVLSLYVALFVLVFLFSFHVFVIAISKIRANKIAPAVKGGGNANDTTTGGNVYPNPPSGADLGGYPELPNSPLPFHVPLSAATAVAVPKEAFVAPLFFNSIGDAFLERYNQHSKEARAAGQARKNMMLIEQAKAQQIANATAHILTNRQAAVYHRTGYKSRVRYPTDEEDSGISNIEDGSGTGQGFGGIVNQAFVKEEVAAGEANKSSNEKGVLLAEQTSKEEPLTTSQALWKAFTKSFRLSLVDIATYMLFIWPSVGMALCPIYGYDDPNCGRQIYFGIVPRYYMIFFFIMARTIQPALLIVNDKILRKKIDAIVRRVAGRI